MVVWLVLVSPWLALACIVFWDLRRWSMVSRALKDNRHGDQPGVSLDFAALIDVIRQEGRANRKEEQREDWGKTVRDWVTVGMLGLTMIGVFWQVHEMIEAYGPIKDQAIATGESAKATGRAADAATKSAEGGEKSVLLSQRAWVGPTNASIDGPVEVDKPVQILINYSNSGREPALNFIYAADIFATTPEEDKAGVTGAKVEASFKGCREVATLRPGQAIFPNASGTMTVTKEKVVDQPVVDGDKTLVIDGCFLYKSFDVVRHSYFCYYYRAKQTKPANLNICTNGAGAD